MNRRLRWLAVTGVAAMIGAAVGASVSKGVSWVNEQPRLKDTPASYLQVQQGSSQYIAVPQLQDLPPPIWVRSTIESADREYTLTSPVFMLSNAQQNYEVAVPSNLKKGVYTVSVVVGYKMNPVRYVEQSLVIALLIIDGGDHAVSGNSKSVGPTGATGAGRKSAAAG